MSISATQTTQVSDSSDKNDSAFLGHPKGLGYIVFTEAWERFSFYGMQALLILYLTSYLLLPGNVDEIVGFSVFKGALETLFGPLSTQALATQLVGLYIGFVYFTPVLGGFVGDRYIGRTRAVIVGAILMAIGHFLMALEAAFLFALLFLIIGSGFLKGNLTAQVGQLYKTGDQRRDSAYSIYTIALIVGAFAAPLVCGTLGEVYGWHYGFGIAGAGMLAGMVIYICGRKYLPEDPISKVKNASEEKLKPGDGKTITIILLLLSITALFWTAQTQVWNTYPLWVKGRVDREIFDLTIPVSWFQSIDTLAVLIFAPIILLLWKNQSKRKVEPSDLNKIAIGCIVFACACLWLAWAEMTSSSTEKISLIYPIIFHLICSVGFLYTSPSTLSLVSRAAPQSVNSALSGCYYLAIFFGGIFSGWLGRYYELLSPSTFWLMHASIVALGGVLIILLRGSLLKRFIKN